MLHVCCVFSVQMQIEIYRGWCFDNMRNTRSNGFGRRFCVIREKPIFSDEGPLHARNVKSSIPHISSTATFL